MINRFAIPALLGAFCGATAASAQDQAVRHAQALTIFDAACLQTLPGFADAGEKFVAEGLKRNDAGYWVDDERGLIAQTTSSDDDTQRGCFVAISQADIAALDAVLGQSVGGALGVEEVGVITGPSPGDPSLYVVDRDGYRFTAVAAHISRGYAMLSASVVATGQDDPPWSDE